MDKLIDSWRLSWFPYDLPQFTPVVQNWSVNKLLYLLFNGSFSAKQEYGQKMIMKQLLYLRFDTLFLPVLNPGDINPWKSNCTYGLADFFAVCFWSLCKWAKGGEEAQGKTFEGCGSTLIRTKCPQHFCGADSFVLSCSSLGFESTKASLYLLFEGSCLDEKSMSKNTLQTVIILTVKRIIFCQTRIRAKSDYQTVTVPMVWNFLPV